MSEHQLHFPSADERLAGSHAIEWANGWQYATTYRIVRGLHDEAARTAARAEPPAELLVPPDGEGWERNVDRGDGGWGPSVPHWCNDGTALLQRVYWRRRKAGIPSWDPRARLSVARDDISL